MNELIHRRGLMGNAVPKGEWQVNWNQLLDYDSMIEEVDGIVQTHSNGIFSFVGVSTTSRIKSFYTQTRPYANNGDMIYARGESISGTPLFAVDCYGTGVLDMPFYGNDARVKRTSSAGTFAMRINNVINEGMQVNESWECKIINITQLFGVGNEPPLTWDIQACVNLIKAWLAENNLDGYQPYNEGEIRYTTKPSWIL